jgi:hypothetical protein
MRAEPDEEYPEFIRRLREQARRDAEELVPRPDFPVYGLAEPSLTPAFLAETMGTNGEWTWISLTYGRPEDLPAGPYVAVTTIAVPPKTDPPPTFAVGMPRGRHGPGVEGELRFAVEREEDRSELWADDAESGGGSGAGDSGAGEPFEVARETLPAGEALVVRRGNVWAARLPAGEPRVAVTVVGRGVSPESVRLEVVPSLRPLVEARGAELTRRIELTRARMRLLPAPDLPPAEGVAALRALTDFTLVTGAKVRAARAARRGAGPDPRLGRDWLMSGALWQRAIAERRRLAGEDQRTAEDVVTSAVNHLGQLASDAAWFAADERLREAVIDETLRHAMLGERVPSERAQYLWARYWAGRIAGPGQDPGPEEPLTRAQARERFKVDWSAAWEAWTANA